VFLNGQKGAPLDYVRGDYRLLGDASYMSLFHKAPHPNSSCDEAIEAKRTRWAFFNSLPTYL
jgi:hypothetical protein